ncbi:MAG: sigma-54-dependent transcriptional regulator [Fidelibacterota bacterium]
MDSEYNIGMKRKILVIDDNEQVCTTIKSYIESDKYEIHLAFSGRDGLESLKSREYDLVITDLKMPDVDGFQIIDYIITNQPETLVVIITAYASLDSAIEAIHKGAFDYIVKPFHFDKLELTVEKAIEKKTADERLRFYEKVYKGILNSMNVAISINTPEYEIYDSNTHLKNLLEVKSSVIKCYKAYFHRETPCDNCPMERTLTEGSPFKAVIKNVSRKNQFEVKTSPLFSSGGRISAVMEVISPLS